MVMILGSKKVLPTSSQSIEPLLNSPMVLLISIEVIFNPIVVLSSSIENAFQFHCGVSNFFWVFLSSFCVESHFQCKTFQFYWGASQPVEVLFNVVVVLLSSIELLLISIGLLFNTMVTILSSKKMLNCFLFNWSSSQFCCSSFLLHWVGFRFRFGAFQLFDDKFQFQWSSLFQIHWYSSQSVEPLLNSVLVLLTSIEVFFNSITVLPSSIELIFFLLCWFSVPLEWF